MSASSTPQRRGVALALASALAVGALGQATTAVAAPAPSLPQVVVPQDDPDATVDAAVTSAVAAGEEATFFVVMEEEADLSEVPTDASHAARAEATVEVLQETAETAQEPVHDLLDAEGVGYEPFWIANVVKVTSDDPGVVAELAALQDVAEIIEEQHYEMQGPAAASAVASAVAAVTLPAADEVVPEWGVMDVKADQVWAEYGDRGEGIVVANIDSGVQFDHPALVESYRGNLGDGTFSHDYNFFDPTGACGDTPCDNNGHGTHTMGTIVGAAGIGVAPGATWIAAKGCESRSCSESSLLAAGQWILAPTDANGQNPRPDLAPHVVNNSWGGGYTAFYGDTVAAWNAAGILDAFAAGNSGDGTTCSTAEAPGAQEAVYAVGAYDSDGEIANFSGFGPSAVDGSMTPSIAAPGVRVRSAWPGSTYRNSNGTSMATPHVAGAVALLWSQAPSLIGDIEGTRQLLGQTARDVDNTSCGGDAGNNNVWGEGKLDALALVDEAPHTAAIVTGTVTSGGEPAGNVTITATGSEAQRTVRTTADGTYRMTLVPGTYTLSVAGYGYLPESLEIETTEGTDVTRDFSLEPAATHAVTGTVLDANGAQLAGATVSIPGTPLAVVTTDVEGAFTFEAVAEGSYGLSVVPPEPQLCNGTGGADLVVGAGTAPVTIELPDRTDVLGNSCSETTSRWVKGQDTVDLTGDEDATTIDLPFPVDFYGVTYSSASLTTNGLVNFLQPRLGDYANTPLPAQAAPNGVIAAYWDDLVLDKRSRVSTTTKGKDGARAFAITWDDAALASNDRARVSFQVIFDEPTGEITLQYRGLKGAPEQGSSATIGIENQAGTIGLGYSTDAATLDDRTAIVFTPGSGDGADEPGDGSDEPGDDGSEDQRADAMVLTQEQSDDLSERLALDPYGEMASDEDTREKAEDFAPAAEEALTLSQSSAMENVTGMARTTAIGTDGDYLVVHALGNVARYTADGDLVWAKGNRDFYEEWQTSPIRPWQTEPFRARIIMGFNAVNVGTPNSDQGYAVGDLTGDGVDDVAVSASVGVNPYRPFTSPGSSLPNGTFVSILDGETGEMVWHRLYPAAFELAIVGETLLVADSPSSNMNAPADATATLTALRFSADGEDLTAEELWSHDTGASRGAVWAAIQPIDDGQVAVSWNLRKTTMAAVPEGHILVLDLTDGSEVWSAATDRRYSRQLHLDADHDRILALEQSDTLEAVEYAVTTYSLASGDREVLSTRINALPMDMAVSELGTPPRGGGRQDGYVVSEVTFDPFISVNASTLRAFDGRDGDLMWSRTVKRDETNTSDGAVAWNVEIVDKRVVASYGDDAGSEGAANYGGARFARLAVLDGAKGVVQWEERGVVASQAWAQPVPVRGGTVLRTVDADQNVWTYDLRRGAVRDLMPLRGELSSGLSTQVDGDGHPDIVVGGESRGVWAYSGPSLVNGEPEVLWRATMPGQVHKIVAADVTGDGSEELLVAADTATVILDRRTGRVLRTIDGEGQFVRTVAASDLDGDGADEIVVATDAVRAYDDRGRSLWAYTASQAGDVAFADVSFGDGRVYAQYASVGAYNVEEPVAGAVALNAEDGTVVWTIDPEPEGSTDDVVRAIPLRHGTFAAPEIPYADGHAVVFTWYAGATDPVNTNNFVEIRDGRTGELLHTEKSGGLWTHGNFLTTPEGDALVQAGSASLRTFQAGGVDFTTFTMLLISTAEFATGPDGRPLLVAGGAGGVNLHDPSILTAGVNYPSPLASAGIAGGREFLVADLDSDGLDEVISLNFDVQRADREAELMGGRYRITENGIREMVTLSMNAS